MTQDLLNGGKTKSLQSDADSAGALRSMGSEGGTLDMDTILLPENPTRSAVFEELKHTAQLRRGMTDVTQMEIEAQEWLINNRIQLRLPNNETRQTIQRLRNERAKLEE